MALFREFVGPTYTQRSLKADSQKSTDLYVELVESGSGKNKMALYQRPGLQLHCTLDDSPVRGVWGDNNERLFAAAGSHVYEIFDDKTFVRRPGTINPAATPVQFFPNGNQLFIVSGDQGYLDTGTTIIPVVPARTGAFLDSFFIAALPQSNKFVISDPLNGKNWSTSLEFGVKQGYPDNIASILAAREELFLLGTQTGEIWRNTGNALFPFERSPMGFIEVGCGAPFSPASLGDNTICWLGGGIQGAAVVWRMVGYKPYRISNHAVETAIEKYAQVGDAVGYGYRDQGHTFYVLSFSAADTTWVYDATTSEALGMPMWHQRHYWDPKPGKSKAALARFHAYTLNKHFVGDYRNGNIYQQSVNFLTDNGDPIRRVRRAPHLFDEANWTYYRDFQVDMEVGTAAAGIDPQVMMRFSDDGGLTWSNEKWASAGKTGEYKKRVIWRRLGRSRDRVFEIVVTDPVNVAIVEAYVNGIPGLAS